MKESLDNSTTSETEGAKTEAAVTETTENLAPTGETTQEAAQQPTTEAKTDSGLITAPSQEAASTEEATKTFMDDLPESLKEDKSLQNFKSVEDLAKSYVEQRRLVGKKIEDMTPEEVAKFNVGIGVPETADGYDFGLKETDDYNKELVDWFGNTSHELGISQDKAKVMLEKYTEMEQEQSRLAEQKQIQTETEQVAGLKADWGPEFENRLELAKKGVERLGGDDLREILETSRLGSHPALAKAFAEVGAMIAEDPSISGKSASKFGMSTEDAKSEIQKFEVDQKSAIYDRRHPDHKWAIEKRSQLYKLAASTKE